MYLTTVMHTDNCTQHMNTYLKKGVRRDSSGGPMAMESQSYNRTDCILKSTSNTASEDAISLEAEKENMSTVWPLAFGIHSVFNQQFCPIIYSWIRMFSSSPLRTYHSVLFHIFWHEAPSHPPFFWSPTISWFFYSFLPQWTVGYQALLGGLWALN